MPTFNWVLEINQWCGSQVAENYLLADELCH